MWGCFDYNQQEPRLVVHYALLQKLYGVDKIADAYKEEKVDFHKIVADMADIPRTQAKTINLGLFYGMGKAKLQAQLGVSKEKTEELLRKYHTEVPFVNQLLKRVMSRADERGQIRTLLGRLCRFHLWEPRQFGIHKALPHDQALLEHGPGIKHAYTYKALNKLIQGSAADMTKKAMVNLHKEGIIPHIQVHDELDISVKDDKEARQIVQIMESAVELEVPNKVDYESGDNWGEIN
jgi:DNA polymerase I-like protein with 3'-5' exonuclease and polymerase domains